MTSTSPGRLARWYGTYGRHDLPWRRTRDRWSLLVAEVMLAQTQVPRVVAAWPVFLAQFPTPHAAAASGPGAVIEAWGRLGYPRRARRLWDAAVIIDRDGWPADLQTLPGVGRYTAGAVHAECDDELRSIGVDVNIRRVCERVAGDRLSEADAERVAVRIGRPLLGRDRLLALMDLGALVCRARDPRCGECPLRRRCRTRGIASHERRRRVPRYEGSFRERRGAVLAALRAGSPLAATTLDGEALRSLIDDGLAAMSGGFARLPDA